MVWNGATAVEEPGLELSGDVVRSFVTSQEQVNGVAGPWWRCGAAVDARRVPLIILDNLRF